MKWKQPPLNKVYEALGAIGDGRIEVTGDSAKVYSSSLNKYYDVIYDAEQNAISSNDNGSHWQGYLGYPSIAFLLAKGLIKYDAKLAGYLTGFAWKDINQQFKNDFNKTDAYIDEQVVSKYQIDLDDFHHQLQDILDQAMKHELNRLSGAKKPPAGY